MSRVSNNSEIRKDIIIQLYIAGDSPNSRRAISNLTLLLKDYHVDEKCLQIINVLDSPLDALANGILVTPTLLKISPPPATRIIGDMSDRAEVVSALNLDSGNYR